MNGNAVPRRKPIYRALLPGLPDEIEEDSPGAWVKVNDDDDNDSGIEDWLDTGTVAGDDDLVPVSLSTPADCTWELTCLPAGAVRFWCDSARTQPLVPTSSGFYEGSGSAGTIYMEGIYPTDLGGLWLTLRTREPDDTVCADTVRATVVQCKIVWPKKPLTTRPTLPDGLKATFVMADNNRRQSNQAVADNSDVLGPIEHKRLRTIQGIVTPLDLEWEVIGAIGTLNDNMIATPTHIPPSSGPAEGMLRLKAKYLGNGRNPLPAMRLSFVSVAPTPDTDIDCGVPV